MPARKTTAQPAQSESSETMIPVRMTLHVMIDPAKWEIDNQPGKIDGEKLHAGLLAAGMDPEAARVAANRVLSLQENGRSGVNAIRTSVRDYVVANLDALPKLADAGATVSLYQHPARRGRNGD